MSLGGDTELDRSRLSSDRLRLLDTRWLGRGGPGRVTEMLLRGFAACPPPGRWMLWGEPGAELSWPGSEVRAAPHDPHAWLGQRASWSVPPAATSLWPHQYRPLRRTSPVEITFLYDTITLHRSTGARRELQRSYLRRVASMSTRLITISRHSASTIINDLGVDAGRLAVVAPVADPASTARVRALRSADDPVERAAEPYALFIGRFAPHKNLHRLVAAFATSRFASAGRLILVGGTPEQVVELTAFADRHAARVEARASCSQEHLETLLAGATLVVQPSIEEGYGLPVVEALAAGVPVASSSAGALSEAADGQAEMFDPHDVEAMAAAIDRAAACADPVSVQTRGPVEFAWDVLNVLAEAEHADT